MNYIERKNCIKEKIEKALPGGSAFVITKSPGSPGS